jgi:formylglycine-generating enzyme required for sulfatase activity
LSVAAGALVSVASLAAPSYAGIVTFGSDGNTFNASQALQITKDTRGTAKPATSVSWNEAARFVNWLNTSTGHQAAYKFADGSAVNDNIQLWTSGEAGYDVNNKYRNSLAKYVLPSYNEWYKAAYYNPTNSTYYDFPNGSDTRPTAVTGGTGPNTAVYTQSGEASPTGPADVDQAGGLSPYGVMGLGGNAREWQESSFDLANSSVSSSRGSRGGSWLFAPGNLSSRNLPNNDPSFEFYLIGFRVAMVQPVPEPSMMVIGIVFGLGGLAAKRRMKK